VLTFGMRSGGHALLLALGFGLIPMATWTLLMNFQFCILFYASLRRIFPGLHLSYHLAHVGAWRKAAHYGVHSLLAGISAQLLDQTAPVVIGLFRPAEYVGYFSLPARLMQYTSELGSRVGAVAAPQAAELAAKHRMDRVIRLSMYANRYCLSIFSPMAIVLFVWGRELMRAWVNEDFSAQSADVLPVLVLGTAMVLAQGTSGSVLFGLGKHQGYAFTLLTEAIGSSLMMLFVVPKFGIIGAAWVSATWMILARGFWVPHLVCKQLGCHYPAYMASIYTRPVLIGLPVCGLAILLKQRLFPGDSLMQLAMAGAIVALVYVLIALRVSVEPEHRAVLVRWLEHHGILPDRGT
jgi:O-antigen/teichoic acid export membrane protein